MVLTYSGGRGGPPSGGAGDAPYPEIQTVRAYWEALRGHDGTLPARAAIDPRGLAPALDHVFVGERIAPGLIRMRIAGMGLTDLAGIDMKGLPASTLFLPEARLRLAEAVERVLNGPATLLLHLEAERTIGRPALDGQLLLLPVISSLGGRDLVLGCCATRGQIGRAPRRFAITRVTAEPIALPERAPLVKAPAAAPAFAENPAPAPRAPKGRGHLRLVHSA